MRIDNTNHHQIIFPGEVIDNQDPMMLGRLRIRPETETYQDMIKSVKNPPFNEETDAWTERDPFIFLPLLPLYINQIPKNKEYVHIIYMNKLFSEENKFYVQGPFSSPMNLPFEYFQSSKTFLATGIRYEVPKGLKSGTNPKNKNTPRIEFKPIPIKKTEQYKTKKSYGIFPEPGDNALLGRGTADVVVKENEVILRAGKTNFLDSSTLPTENAGRSFLQLSYFRQTKELGEPSDFFKLSPVVKVVKKIIIWDIINLENNFNQFIGSVGLYNVIPSTKVNTTNFKSDSILNLSIGTDYVGPLEEFRFTNMSLNQVVNLINSFIKGLFEGNLDITGYTINNQNNFSPDSSFPFVVSPSKITMNTGQKFNSTKNIGDFKQQVNYQNFYSKINLNSSKSETGFFLVSENVKDIPTFGQQIKSTIERVTPTEYQSAPVSYSILGGQNILFLSQSAIGPKGQVSLNETLYGIDQDKLVGAEKSIMGLTYPTVRGDLLITLLRKMFSFLVGHVHTISTVPPIPIAAGNGQSTAEISALLNEAEKTILNQNIRIN